MRKRPFAAAALVDHHDPHHDAMHLWLRPIVKRHNRGLGHSRINPTITPSCILNELAVQWGYSPPSIAKRAQDLIAAVRKLGINLSDDQKTDLDDRLLPDGPMDGKHCDLSLGP